MAIKLFFKHLFTGIKRRPAQPLLLMVIIMVAVSVCVISLELGGFMEEEITGGFYASNGNANIVISVSANTSGRFLDADKVKDVLGEDTTYCGTFTLPFYIGDGKTFSNGVVTELDSVDDIFTMNMVDSKKLPKNNGIRKAVYVTDEVANKYALSVGSELKLTILGNQNTYIVYGITTSPIMGEYDIMMDIKGLEMSLDANTQLKMELYGFKPCGTIYIHTTGNPEDDVITLQNTKEFASANILHVIPATAKVNESMDAISKIIVLMTVVLAILTIYVCFAILTAQRKDENALFYAVGAKSYMLNALSIAEMFVYWLFGFLAGIGLSYAVVKLFGWYVGYEYCVPQVKISALAISGALVLAATEVGMCLFILSDKLKKYRIKKKIVASKEKSEKSTKALAICTAAGVVVCTIAASLLRFQYKRVFGLVGLLCVFLMTFSGTKTLFVRLSGKISKSSKLAVPVRYAVKNASRVESQSNVAALLPVFLTILTLIVVMYNFAVQSNVLYKRTIDADYLLANVPEDSISKLVDNADCPSVDAINKIYAGEVYDKKGLSVIVLCADDIEALNEKFDIPVAPKGAQVVLGESYLQNQGYHMNGKYTFTYGGQQYEATIVGTAKMNSRILVVDAEFLGVNYSYYSVKSKDGVSSEALYREISTCLEGDNADIIPVENLLATGIQDNENSIHSMEIIAIAMVIFAIIGLSDSIVSGYRSRREEFECYAGAGMNKTSLRIMKVSETIYALLFGFVCYLLAIGFAWYLMYQTTLGFSINILYI